MKHYSTYQSQFIEMFSAMTTTPVKTYVDDSFPGEWGTEDTIGDGVKVIRTTNFTNSGKLNLADVVTRSIEDRKIARKQIKKYDTILERSGGTADNPVGRVVLFEEDDLFLCNNFTQVLRFKDIDPRFAFYSLYYFYQTNKTAIRSMGSKTTGIQNLNMSKYLEIGIPNASDEEQKEFVAIAEQADKSKFTSLKSQFIEMVGDQNTNDKGWPESLVKDEFKLSMGKTPARNNPECWNNGVHKWVSISDMSSYTRYTGDTSEYITDYAIADSGIKAVLKGTIIMSFKLSIGRTAITSEDIYTNEAIMAFADFDKKKFNIDFLHFLIANKNWLLGAKQAVKGQTLNKESIGNAKIIIPPIETQEEFARIYNQADKSKFELRKSIEAIDAVIKSLING